MSRGPRLLLAACLALFALSAQAASVLFIATGNVPPGKFRQLADIARPHGIEVAVRHVDKLPANVDAGLFAGADAVFFDTYLLDYVRGKLAAALPGLRAPHAWLYDAEPSWGGLPEPLARRLIAYYTNGGRANFEGFFATLAAHLAGRPAEGIADPVVFPKIAVYHPQAPGLVFADPLAYLAWKGVDPAAPDRPPVVAIAMHQQYLASMQTDFLDDLIARIEAGGAVPLAVYAPVMDAAALSGMLRPADRLLADAMINVQITLNPEGRRKELEALGIPVVQAMPYRRGDAADWAADPHGVTLMDVPFYLAQAEYAGVIDIQIAAATRKDDDQIVPIAPQAAAVVNKALRLVALQRKPNADKRVAVMFWNYPSGEKNLSASFLNVPRSLVRTLAALRADGYTAVVPDSEHALLPQLQRLLAPYYRDGQLEALLRDDLAALMPVSAYRQWLAELPQPVQRELADRWGEPEQSTMVVRRGGEPFFVVPRLMLGNVAVMPQPPRGEKWDDRERALYHSAKAGPSHFFFAAYLWARQQHASDALVHFGTHGIQEWLPGKERGLSVFDAPMLAIGDVPVAYPYIADNIGEAQQAKRRGRAVIVSHQTPPFKPAGLHAQVTAIHDLLHAWLAQDEGAVKERLKADLLSAVAAGRIHKDMGWPLARASDEFAAFVEQLHNHLHELAETAQPLGLHTLGKAPDEPHRLATVLLMLGRPFWEAAARQAGVRAGEVDEAIVGDYEQLAQSVPFRLLQRHLLEGAPIDELEPALREHLRNARKWHADIGADRELPALLAVLAGRHLRTSYGGDPIKNPDAYPTGNNLYGFDPSRVPTRQFHPGYIKGLMAEGYAGTLQVLDATNNFWGWTAVAREIVRDDQWQEMVDVYVRDKHDLGLKDWFERENPHALAQTVERMLEAARQGYWRADAKVVAELKARYRQLAARFDVRSDNARFAEFVAESAGYGLDRPAAAAKADAARPPAPQPAVPPPEAVAPPEPPAEQAPAPEIVTGQMLERVEQTPPANADVSAPLLALLLAALAAAGAARQAGPARSAAPRSRRPRPAPGSPMHAAGSVR